MKIFQSIEKLKLEIEKQVKSKKLSIITIDGYTGTGKSYLAKSLCNGLGFIHIELDDKKYKIQNIGKHIDAIKYDILEKDINENLRKNLVIIIDSICALETLFKIGINSDLKIFIKRMSSYGLWRDEDCYNYEKSADDYIQKDMDAAMKFEEVMAEMENRPINTQMNQESYTYEIVRYNHKYKPDEISDLIYERCEV